MDSGTTGRSDGTRTTRLGRLVREPTLHFFALAAAILLGQRLVAGDPRTIEITPALKADLLRRYQDQLNRPPTSAEAEAFMAAWKADEALYREALRVAPRVLPAQPQAQKKQEQRPSASCKRAPRPRHSACAARQPTWTERESKKNSGPRSRRRSCVCRLCSGKSSRLRIVGSWSSWSGSKASPAPGASLG